MARGEIERTVQQSVLDRLIDNDPRAAADPPTTFVQSARQYKATVRRDIEALLNTRRIPEEAPDELEELRHSLYHYGLPDISSMSSDSVHSRTILLQRVEETIALFEPRLADVRVSLTEAVGTAGRELRFIIEGTLRMDPSPEQVVFDTVLELSRGEYQVGGATGA
ncbi:MAG TPA: type VI secretion system baseplate subunit TssE [Gemmatimonadaceae bacterium]|nr:type VI secretion system baseplate subunit TssE [Gemmatimonadaceae bacterium]